MTKKALFIALIFSVPALFAQRFLVFGGKTGWIGKQVVELIKKEGHQAFAAQSRLENREAIERELLRIKPDCVINTAGITGRPNVDWGEDNKQETIRANILGMLNLVDICYVHDIHCTTIGTGCIYEYDAKHQMNSGIGFTEQDQPNFHGSFYSHSKVMLDDLVRYYPNSLMLRLRMPVSSDLFPRSFVTKITQYKKVVNIPNSMSILDDLLPLIHQMAARKLVGTYNFVNPGTLSHNEILDLYKEYVDPTFTYQNFTLEEQAKILKAGRSNCELDASKLLREFPQIPHVKDSIKNVFAKMKSGLKSNN